MCFLNAPQYWQSLIVVRLCKVFNATDSSQDKKVGKICGHSRQTPEIGLLEPGIYLSVINTQSIGYILPARYILSTYKKAGEIIYAHHCKLVFHCRTDSLNGHKRRAG